MTDFNVNKRKTRLAEARIALTQRAKNARQQLKSLKKIEGWNALLKPDRMRRPRARRAGVTMFDVALWTLVLIPVLIGVLSLYQGAVDSTRKAALRSQLTRAVAIIERDHIYSGVYVNVDGSLLIFLKNEGFTNKELGDVDSALKFTSPYGTDIAITGSGGRTFTVKLDNLPASGCETAGMTFANQNSGLKNIKIGAGDGAPVPAITEAEVSKACAADGPINVVLTF